ncbi:alpha,alpha-trehalase nth1 [Coemansia sp. RSA 552]|nr:alpha,alpha-trehalase nth1 [Coemansia sp. RSA 552]
MHILSSIRQHVVSAAAGASSATSDPPPAEARPPQKQQQQHRSLREVLRGSSAKSKHRRLPCPPPVSIQTKDISWPVDSGDRDSPQLGDYDVLDTGDVRSPVGRGSSSFDQPRAVSASAATGAVYGARMPPSARDGSGVTFPLSRRRGAAYGAPLDTVFSGVAAAADSRGQLARSTSLSSTSTSTSARQQQQAYSAPLARRLGSISPPIPLLSPTSPTSDSTFSYVDVRMSCSPSSPLSVAASLDGKQVRGAGTVNSLRTPGVTRHGSHLRLSTPRRSPSPTGRRTDLLYQSLTLLDVCGSTSSTVVSAALLNANRPPSSKSGNSAASGTLVPEAQPKKPAEDDDAMRGPPPRDDWDVVLDRIKEYRAAHEAPVDTVGCEALTEEEKDPKLRRFRSLISLMLSAQTKDEITADAVRTLSNRLSGGLTPRALSEAPIDLIHECVRRVGFWQRKSNYIREAARTCLEQYDGDIPRTVPQLLSLPGVGPKMAYLAMHAAWQDTQGIGVDTHVLRITHRLGWVPESVKSPEATRHSLESWMPRSLWREINPLLVGFGQVLCRGVGPKCDECPVNRFCPSAQVRPRPSSSRRGADRMGHGAAGRLMHDSVLSDSAEFGDVDMEDLASMVRGAEHAVRSRKAGTPGTRARAVPLKTRFPEMPESPLTNTAVVNNVRAVKSRARAASRLRPRQSSTPIPQSEDSDYYASRDEKDVVSDSEQQKRQARRRSSARKAKTGISSKYFMRSRSNAASEEVRPEAKTDSVRSARAKVSAAKLYSRRLSKSDMQWALGEAWDPDDSSSLSSLSDICIPEDAEDDVKEEECSDVADNTKHHPPGTRQASRS